MRTRIIQEPYKNPIRTRRVGAKYLSGTKVRAFIMPDTFFLRKRVFLLSFFVQIW